MELYGTTNDAVHSIFVKKSAHFGPPARDPVWGPLWRGFQRSSFSLLLNKISWCVHTCTSIRSFTLLLSHCIEKRSHFFTIFCSFWTPLPETPVWRPPWRGSQRSSFFSLLLNKISWCIHTCTSIRSFTLLLTHCIEQTSHFFFINFYSFFWTPCQRPLFGGPFGEGPRGAHFHYSTKISWYVHTCTSIRSFTLLLTHCIEQTSHSSQFFCSFLDPARDPLFGGPFGEGSQRSSFSLFLIISYSFFTFFI